MQKKLIMLLLAISVFGLLADVKVQNPQCKVVTKTQETLAIIKPDATSKKLTGDIIKTIELNGFKIVKMTKLKLNKKQAQKFYEAHKDRPFYDDLVNYMVSGPIVVLMLKKENAIADWRKLMGSTNPEKADVGTIRKMYGKSIQENAVHGSDSTLSSEKELKFFFK